MSAPTLRLDGELTIYRAAALKTLLLADDAPLLLDLSSVEEIDSAGVQLLLMARRDRRALTLLDPSQPVRDVLALLGLSERFDIGSTA